MLNENEQAGVCRMPVANCKRCGRIYNRLRRDICPQCVHEEEEIFLQVRTFLKNHRNANLQELAEGVGVDPDIIVGMIQDGRIILRDNPNISYPCEKCGKPTQSGRLCAVCSAEMVRDLQIASSELSAQKEKSHKGKGFYSR